MPEAEDKRVKAPGPLQTLDAFYPYYLSEHSHLLTRRLHVVGTLLGFILMLIAVVLQVWWLLAVALLQGYALAWVGHFFFEHNKPATFEYPRLSFLADLRLCRETLTGKRPF